jgi:hypothetical protein
MCRPGILLVGCLVIRVVAPSLMTLMVGIVHAPGQDGGGLWMQLGKSAIPASLLHIVWIVTFRADKPALFAI